MADVTISAANTIAVAGSQIEVVTSNDTITQGQAVYKNPAAANRVDLCDADAAATADCYGISLNSAAAGQPLSIIRSGNLSMGNTLTAGTVYCVSTTPGGIAPEADLGSGDYKTVLGVATSAFNLKISIINSGTAEP